MLHAARTHRTEHITRTEGRALAWGLCHVFRHRGSKPCRAVFVGGQHGFVPRCQQRSVKQPLAKAHPALDRRVQSCDHGSHIAIRWIPSEYNPSDGPSRGKRPDGSSWSQPRAAPAAEDGFVAEPARLRGGLGALRLATASAILDMEKTVLESSHLPGPLRDSPYRRAEGGRPAKLAERRPHPSMAAHSGLISHLESLLIAEPTLRTYRTKVTTFCPVVLVAPPGLELPGRVGRDAPHRLRRDVLQRHERGGRQHPTGRPEVLQARPGLQRPRRAEGNGEL